MFPNVTQNSLFPKLFFFKTLSPSAATEMLETKTACLISGKHNSATCLKVNLNISGLPLYGNDDKLNC